MPSGQPASLPVDWFPCCCPQAIANAKAVTDKPSLIKVSTLIGYGSPNKADTHDVHGAPLGPDETAATRENLKWDYKEFDVPQEVYDVMRSSVTRGASAEEEWNANFAQYKAKYPKEAEELEGLIRYSTGSSTQQGCIACIPCCRRVHYGPLKPVGDARFHSMDGLFDAAYGLWHFLIIHSWALAPMWGVAK